MKHYEKLIQCTYCVTTLALVCCCGCLALDPVAVDVLVALGLVLFDVDGLEAESESRLPGVLTLDLVDLEVLKQMQYRLLVLKICTSLHILFQQKYISHVSERNTMA